MSSEILYITDDSQIIYNSSKNGDFFALRDIKNKTFDVYQRKKLDDSNFISTQIISINIAENKFPEMDSNKTFFKDKYACITTSDKICYLVDLFNKRKTSINNQSRINKVIFDEKTLTMGIVLNQSDGTSLIKIFKLNSSFELQFIDSIIDDDKKNINDLLFDEQYLLISYKNIIELRNFSKLSIPLNLFHCNEEISLIKYFSKKANDCIISTTSGNMYHINLFNKIETFIIKPTSCHYVNLLNNNTLVPALILSTFDKELYIYIINEKRTIYICDIPNIYLSSVDLRGDILSLAFLNGIIIIIWFGDINNPICLKKFKITEYCNGEETVNNIWQFDLKDKIDEFILGYQTTNGIFLLK
jgi:hypothetical protein